MTCDASAEMGGRGNSYQTIFFLCGGASGLVGCLGGTMGVRLGGFVVLDGAITGRIFCLGLGCAGGPFCFEQCPTKVVLGGDGSRGLGFFLITTVFPAGTPVLAACAGSKSPLSILLRRCTSIVLDVG